MRYFVERSGAELAMQIEWRGRCIDEQGVDVRTGRAVARVDARYFRPTEVDTLLGDPSKARDKLGWQAKTSFEALVREMVASDLEAARRDALVAREGFRTFQRHE